MKQFFLMFILFFIVGCSITGNVIYESDGRPIITKEELNKGFNVSNVYRFHVEKGISINIDELNTTKIDYVVEIREKGYRFWFNSEGPHSEYSKYPQFKKFSTIIGGKTRLYQIISLNKSYILKNN